MMKHRETPIELSKDEFKEIGYQLIDSISDFIATGKWDICLRITDEYK
jgi:hypothetical protein